MVEDLLDVDSPMVTPTAVQESLIAEHRLEGQWRRYLGRRRDLRWWANRASRWIRRTAQRLLPPSTDLVRRLLNIELSHLSLMRQGLESGADWVLILEDDAFALDIKDLSDGLVQLMREPDAPHFVDLSGSFTPRELGIEHLLIPLPGTSWAGTFDRALMSTERPVTNTVCAILYSAPFLAQIVAKIDELPMEPVVPIDWKLNQALMNLYAAGQVGAGDFWLVDPAPIMQMSMQPAGILIS